ncbi:MAG: FAD-dependent oxidoreductase [Arenicellales bacterium]|nr:FAD-dependent oxidoreductase [Arenicellales bacterium]
MKSDYYDAIVIGGGVMGCSILWHLAKRQFGRLLLLERDTIGSGSTGRSSGIVRMHYSTEVNTRLAVESQPVFQNWHDVVGEGDAGWVQTGFIIFADARYRQHLEKSVNLQQQCGARTSIVSTKDAREVAPMFRIGDTDAVAFEPESGYGDPSGVAAGYLAAARAMGADVKLGTRVTDIQLNGERISGVIAGGPKLRTETVIVATGPWSQQIMRLFNHELPLRATWHQVIMLRRATPNVHMHPGGADFANRVYFRPEAMDLTLLGNGNVEREANPDDYQTGVNMDYVQDVWSRFAKRAPDLETAEFTHGYAGLYTTTPDAHPIIDRVDGVQGVYICTGFSGHGFKLAPAVGRCMSELVLDGTCDDIRSLKMSRFLRGELNMPQTEFRVMV